MNIDEYINQAPFSPENEKKRMLFENSINSLTLHHYENSKEYKKILNFLRYNFKEKQLSKIPFLPAKLFKEFDLKSVSKEKIFKILLSSGTTGNTPSKIHLDRENASNQTKALTKIMSTILGNIRLPMLIIDKSLKITNRSVYNARAAAIYGFSIFGKNYTYILNEKNEIDYNLLNDFLEKYGKSNFFVFGFTSFVFENLIKKLSIKLLKHDFKNGILLHGGGWKKMKNMKISNKIFKKKLLDTINLKNVYNYYGLIEQTGSIFIECKKCSCFVTSIFSDVLIRDKYFNLVKNGDKGLIQLFSLLPTSYPGHSILTEDIGEIPKENNCECKNRGKRFLVYGRAEKSEIRGCSDI